MNAQGIEQVTERSAWTASELADDPTWRYTMSTGEIDELESATAQALASGLQVGEFSREDFPLPSLGPRIAALSDEVENGRGVALLRGVPVQRHEQDSIRVMYWGIGVHAGIPISQNSKGQLLAEVIDKGNDYGDINARGFVTNAELLPHVDTSDMTTLLCLRAARSGGESRVVSSTAVYNAVVVEDFTTICAVRDQPAMLTS
jgi:hypothetical protein